MIDYDSHTFVCETCARTFWVKKITSYLADAIIMGCSAKV